MAGFDGDGGQDGAAPQLEIASGRHRGAQTRSISTTDMELGSPQLMIADVGPLCKPRAGRL